MKLLILYMKLNFNNNKSLDNLSNVVLILNLKNVECESNFVNKNRILPRAKNIQTRIQLQ